MTSIAGEAMTAQPLRVWGRIVRVEDREREGTPARWRLELRVGAESEPPRILESNECRKLAEATAFIVALDLQSRAAAEHPEQHPPTPAVPHAEREGRPSAARPATRRPTPPGGARAIVGGLGGDLAGDHGTLPALGWSGGFFGYIGYGSWRAELGAAFWPRNRADDTSLRGAGASISLRVAGVRGCSSLSFLSIDWIDACFRLEAGALHAAGYGILRPATSDGLWLAGLVGLTARVSEAGPLRVRGTVELGPPLRYPAVTIEGLGQVYAPAPLVVRLGFGLETRLF